MNLDYQAKSTISAITSILLLNNHKFTINLQIVLEPSEEGGYTALVPVLPGDNILHPHTTCGYRFCCGYGD
jgi:hypothetical protein